MRRIALLLLLATIAAATGAFAVWQYLVWRVYVAEGVRDMYATAAIEVVKQCTPPTSQWPRKRGP